MLFSFVFNSIIENANNSFAEVSPCKLSTDLVEVYALCNEIPQIDLPPEADKVEENRQAMHVVADQFEQDTSGIQKKYEFEFDSSLEIDQAAKLNHAFKNIDIIGQILKNHFGDFVAESKQQILEAGMLSGFRIMAVFFEAIATNKEFILSWIIAEVERKQNENNQKKKLSQTEQEKLAKEMLFQLCLFFGYGMTKRLSYSLGNENLEKTFSHLSRPDMTPSEALLLFSYKLDHLRQFPKSDVDLLLKTIGRFPVADFVAKRMAFDFCAKFRTTHELRQFIATKFKLGPSGQRQLLDSSISRDEDRRKR